MSAILELDGLTKRFGDFTAVDSVMLAVEEGEVFGLLGPNGAGSATVAGYDIMRQQLQVRRAIGYVPQALSADGSLTGYENLLRLAASIRTSTVPNTRNATRSATGVLPRMAHSARVRSRLTRTTASSRCSRRRTSSRGIARRSR
jgi:ABC-type multidrug transport system ATPase subunit